jgi:hypothetical protein
MGVLALMFYYKNSKVEMIEVDDCEKADLEYYFDNVLVDKKENKCEIAGWAYKKGEDIGYANDSVILKDTETNQYYKVNTQFVKRTGVTDYVNDGHNYDNSGFLSRFSLSNIPKGRKYQICLKYLTNDNNILCETDEYLEISD